MLGIEFRVLYILNSLVFRNLLESFKLSKIFLRYLSGSIDL